MYMQKRKAHLISLLATIGLMLVAAWFYGGSFSKIPFLKSTPEHIEMYVTKTLEACTTHEYRNVCLKDAAKDFLYRFSLSELSPILKNNEKSPPYFMTCHTLSHYLGQYEYQRLKSVRKVYASTDELCSGGIYHGTIEGYFMEKGIFFDGTPEMDEIMRQEINKVCGHESEYSRTNEFGNCIHGLGHALMYVTNNDLVRALKLCDHVESVGYREACYTGALMQNYNSANDKDHPSIYVKANDPMYPCYILEKRYQSSCYSYGVLTNFQFDAGKAIALCESVPLDYSRECFKTYGRDRVIITVDLSEIQNYCDLVKNPQYRSDCINEAASHLVSRFGIDSRLGHELCDMQGRDQQSSCYFMLVDTSKTLTKDKQRLKKFCEAIQEGARPAQCREL